MVEKEKPKIGLLVASREFFPDELSFEGGQKVVNKMEDAGIKVITAFSPEDDEGLARNREDSKKYAELFKENREELDGVLVTLPNFGDEKSVVETFKLSELDVPIMIHGFADKLGKMDREHRRDSFCGKISICNNLRQSNIKFTNTEKHVESPESQEFEEDLEKFKQICKTVEGLKGSRLGAVGLRPNAFQTVRFSEKILEGEGVSVENISLMKTLKESEEMDEDDSRVQESLEKMENYFEFDLPEEDQLKTAKLMAFLSDWIDRKELDAISFQCWPDIEEYFGISPCGSMSLLSQSLVPSACESDVMGSLSMYALQLASGKPAGLVDINNNYGDDPDKFLAFHCSNFAPCFFENDECELGFHDMQGVYGACHGRIEPGPVTFLRISTDDQEGKVKAFIAEGEFTDDEVETFGGYGVAKVGDIDSLMDLIVEEGFEHHTAMVKAHVGDAIEESLKKYLNWEVYRHS